MIHHVQHTDTSKVVSKSAGNRVPSDHHTVSGTEFGGSVCYTLAVENGL